MSRGQPGSSKARIAESRRLLPTKSDATKAAVLANSPKEVRDAVEQSRKDKDKADKLTQKTETKFEKFVATTKDAAASETGVEVLGGLAAQTVNELGSLGFRALGEWSEKTEGDEGLWAKYVDVTQSIPGAIGTFVYILEKALRPDFDPDDKDLPVDQRRPYMPKTLRRGVSEAAKVAGHLGLSNTIRALRFRWSEGIDERREKAAAIADKDKLLRKANDEIEQMKAQLKQLMAAKGQATKEP